MNLVEELNSKAKMLIYDNALEYKETMGRSVLTVNYLSKQLWAQAFLTVNYLSKRSPSKALDKATSFEFWTKRKRDLSYLKVFAYI